MTTSISSTALKANIEESRYEVTIDERYKILQDIMSKLAGLMEKYNTFLKELSHPLKNWQYIVKEAKVYSLDYFHLLKTHPDGAEAALRYVEIFTEAIRTSKDNEVKADAADFTLLYVQKMIVESGAEIKKFLPVIHQSFDRIRNLEDPFFLYFVRSYYQVKKLAESLLVYQNRVEIDFTSISGLMFKYFQHTYDYWLNEADPQEWFEIEVAEPPDHRWNELFKDISHEQIHAWKSQLESLEEANHSNADRVLRKLIELPGYNRIVKVYREIPDKLLNLGEKKRHGNQWKVLFLFHIMNISGLSVIHEEVLRDINRTVGLLIKTENYRYIKELIERTFSILRKRTVKYPNTALNVVLNMGCGVYKTDDADLVNFFINSVVQLGFQTPMIEGVSNEWKIKVNPAHLQNIRTYLELIELNPKWSTMLLSDLIIHLSFCGVLIKDTDLFPRDITRLLNSKIAPVYNLIKQLAKLFPVYFNDIGAEGRLRIISTKIDEISHRKDVLIHFLRKQSHVESSNRIIGLMEAVIRFWETRDKEFVKPYVPPDIYESIPTSGDYIDGVHLGICLIADSGVFLPQDLLKISPEKIDEILNDHPDMSGEDRERISLAVSLYKMLHHKYSLTLGFEDSEEFHNYLEQFKIDGFPAIDELKEALAETDMQRKMDKILDYLEKLKRIILSDTQYDIREDIYQKRHFAIDIPSMYGKYHEMKFDALGFTFRLEAILNVYFEEVIQNFDFRLITKATFYRIYDLIKLFYKALRIDGMCSNEIERQMDFMGESLEVRGFTFTQYIDIFKGYIQAIKNLINDYFHNIHGKNLNRILSVIPEKWILPRYFPQNGASQYDRWHDRISEVFFRDKIALSLGLQQFDLFLSKILHTLFKQAEELHKYELHQLLLYDSQKAISSILAPNYLASGIIHLGNKGYNLVKLKNFGLPIPPGFIVTTEVFRYREVISNYPPAKRNLEDQIVRHIVQMENATGKIFGDATNPLLFSVRSGSSISQPGMMDTFLNVGINEDIASGLAALTENSWFAWDNYRRFIQCWGMSFDMKRDEFDALMGEFKQTFGTQLKRQFTGEQMRKVALRYKEMVLDNNIRIIEEPLEQLHATIRRVFNSWHTVKAATYRKIMGISDDWGTAVTVQAMVFGNRSKISGTGVFFTHNPRLPADYIRLWGDFTLSNQGEDVVSGLVNTLPISIFQQDIEMRDTDITLETHFPEIYTALKNWAIDLIEKRGWSPQEMEFTFETPSVNDLYLLQTRDMSMRELKKVLTFELTDETENKSLGHGIGVSGGAMSGRVVFTVEEIDKWHIIEPATSLILLRSDTVPDDIREIHAADGLLTARGGLTSHAAVVAHRLDKTCVVGCRNLICKEKERIGIFDNLIIRSGDFISIDGREGFVYQGQLQIISEN